MGRGNNFEQPSSSNPYKKAFSSYRSRNYDKFDDDDDGSVNNIRFSSLSSNRSTKHTEESFAHREAVQIFDIKGSSTSSGRNVINKRYPIRSRPESFISKGTSDRNRLVSPAHEESGRRVFDRSVPERGRATLTPQGYNERVFDRSVLDRGRPTPTSQGYNERVFDRSVPDRGRHRTALTLQGHSKPIFDSDRGTSASVGGMYGSIRDPDQNSKPVFRDEYYYKSDYKYTQDKVSSLNSTRRYDRKSKNSSRGNDVPNRNQPNNYPNSEYLYTSKNEFCDLANDKQKTPFKSSKWQVDVPTNPNLIPLKHKCSTPAAVFAKLRDKKENKINKSSKEIREITLNKSIPINFNSSHDTLHIIHKDFSPSVENQTKKLETNFISKPMREDVFLLKTSESSKSKSSKIQNTNKSSAKHPTKWNKECSSLRASLSNKSDESDGSFKQSCAPRRNHRNYNDDNEVHYALRHLEYADWPVHALVTKIRELEHRFNHSKIKFKNHLSHMQFECIKELQDNSSKRSSVKQKKKEFDSSKYESRHIALKVSYLGWNYDDIVLKRPKDASNARRLNLSGKFAPRKYVEQELLEAMVKTKLIPNYIDFNSINFKRMDTPEPKSSAFCQVYTINSRSIFKDEKDIGDKMKDSEELDYPGILNKVLPPDIRVRAACLHLPHDFSPSENLDYKCYRYVFRNENIKYDTKNKVNIEKLRVTTQKYIGSHDFRNFCRFSEYEDISHGQYSTILDINVLNIRDDMYAMDIKGKNLTMSQARAMGIVALKIAADLEEMSLVDYLLNEDEFGSSLSAKNFPAKPIYELGPKEYVILMDAKFDDASKLEWAETKESNFKVDELYFYSTLKQQIMTMFAEWALGRKPCKIGADQSVAPIRCDYGWVVKHTQFRERKTNVNRDIVSIRRRDKLAYKEVLRRKKEQKYLERKLKDKDGTKNSFKNESNTTIRMLGEKNTEEEIRRNSSIYFSKSLSEELIHNSEANNDDEEQPKRKRAKFEATLNEEEPCYELVE